MNNQKKNYMRIKVYENGLFSIVLEGLPKKEISKKDFARIKDYIASQTGGDWEWSLDELESRTWQEVLNDVLC